MKGEIAMIEDVGSLASYIHEYGPLIVTLSVFLFIFLMLIVYVLNSNKKASEADREMNNKLITSILEEMQNNKKALIAAKTYDEKNIVDLYMKLNNVLKSVCESTLEKTNSDRTAIYAFHNGTSASHGLPFFKMSCISEMISKQSNPNTKMMEHAAIPLNLVDSIVSGLYENSEYRIITEETRDPSDLVFLKNTKIKDCFFVPIYDDDNNMMGFIFNGYNVYNPERDSKQEYCYLVELAKSAKPVIEFSKLQEYNSDIGFERGDL